MSLSRDCQLETPKEHGIALGQYRERLKKSQRTSTRQPKRCVCGYATPQADILILKLTNPSELWSAWVIALK